VTVLDRHSQLMPLVVNGIAVIENIRANIEMSALDKSYL